MEKRPSTDGQRGPIPFYIYIISTCDGASLIKELQKYPSEEERVVPPAKGLDGSEYSVHAQDQMSGSEHYDLISLKRLWH